MSKSSAEGTVVRQHLGHYFVDIGHIQIDCALSSRLRKQLQYPEAAAGSRRQRVQAVRRTRVVDPVAIGDRVVLDFGQNNTGMIREVLPRRNKISRRASGSSKKEQTLAANIDQVVPVFSAAEPEPDWEMLDRMLVIAEGQEIPAVICFNKIDLTGEATARATMRLYESIGYRVVFTSIISDAGKGEFRDLLTNRTTLFMGSSGVGKSSLLNWLQPGLELRTAEISAVTGEGKHTTTHTELLPLDGGGLVGDIPGVREFRLWNITPEDLPYLFPEFQPFLGECRFRNCDHDHEPKCAVKDAVESGDIPRRRYENYLRLRQEP